LNDEQLRSMVLFACEKAIAYGLHDDSRLLFRFVLLLLDAGPGIGQSKISSRGTG